MKWFYNGFVGYMNPVYWEREDKKFRIYQLIGYGYEVREVATGKRVYDEKAKNAKKWVGRTLFEHRKDAEIFANAL